MQVTIPKITQHDGYPGNAIIINISDICPVCGEKRGVPFKGLSYDGSRRLHVDLWQNRCGHIDRYSDVIKEYWAETKSKTLHLNLKRNWYNAVLSGAKVEEYRELTNYWFKRLFGVYLYEKETGVKYNNRETYATLAQNLDLIMQHNNPIAFETITVSNGYAKNRDQFIVELKRVKIGTGQMVWGAQYKRKYFILELGKVLVRKRATN
ncbi:MAG: hypothetical protein COA65_09715 [Rhodospirillaceae bacterium]|nr:MAG: hypothetical protein COA65_09715 [Rhodospirillaceae bacterium]